MRNSGFTLVELLIVAAILAVLSTTMVLVINPIEIIKQTRDSQRLSDLGTISNALSLFNINSASAGGLGTANTLYISLPDTSSICANLGLPTLPSNWSYSCVTISSNLKKNDGTGWIPVNFNLVSGGSPIAALPTDPADSISLRAYYSYVVSGSRYELTANMESQKYTQQETSDGGVDPAMYEVGTNLTLSPFAHGLAGYWNLDEGSGTTANDTSGNGHTSTLSGTTLPAWVSGKVGQALAYDGFTSKVTGGAIALGRTMTIAAWIKKDTSTGQKSFFSNRGGGSVYFGLSSNNVFIYDNAGTPAPVYSSGGVQIGQWQHIVATSDGVTTIFYVNGVPITNALQSRNASTGTFGIGWDPDIATEFWNGSIDEVRVYNRALSAAEVAAIYNATK